MASIDGLSSGMNTTQIINQLMTLERQPQLRLENKKSQTEDAVSLLRDLNAMFLSLRTGAEKFTTGDGWELAVATSSDTDRVSARATAGASPARLTFSVEQLALAGVSVSSGTVSGLDATVATANSTMALTTGTSTTSINVGDGSLSSVIEAINGAEAGVTATAIQVSPGEYKLQLSATTSGADTTITLDDGAGGNPFAASTLGAVDVLKAGRDARLRVGGAGGYTVTRPSNTISDLLQGTTLTLRRADPSSTVTIEVGTDAAAVADGLSGLVDKVNSVLGEINDLTSFNPDTLRDSAFTGDSTMRRLRRSLVNAVIGDGTASAGTVGISVQRTGTIAFDREKFLDAYAGDPDGVQAILGGTEGAPGVAERLRQAAHTVARDQHAAAGPGLLTVAIETRENRVDRLSDRIADWDNRLQLRERTLRGQFAAMEKAVGVAQQQGAWMSSQIAGLPGWGG